MYPALIMLHLTPIQLHHKTHLKFHPDQYADDYHSVCQMMMTPQEMPHQLVEQLQQILK